MAVMPDSGALRQRRHKAHQAGDHRLCRHGPVDGARPVLAAAPDPADAGEFDPRAELVALARDLGAAYRAEPSNASLARELRATLLAIPVPEDPSIDPLDELRDIARRVS